jgi:hypothetical protein
MGAAGVVLRAATTVVVAMAEVRLAEATMAAGVAREASRVVAREAVWVAVRVEASVVVARAVGPVEARAPVARARVAAEATALAKAGERVDQKDVQHREDGACGGCAYHRRARPPAARAHHRAATSAPRWCRTRRP